jgi:hypothetical protein
MVYASGMTWLFVVSVGLAANPLAAGGA